MSALYFRTINIDINLIDTSKSIEATGIHFPYNWIHAASDDKYIINQATLECVIEDIDEIKDVNTYINILPYTSRILCGLNVIVNTFDGKAFKKTILAKPPETTVCKILKAFFTAGAPGMDKEYSGYFQNSCSEYLSKVKA